MKKNQVLLVLAIVIAMFSFGFKAKAQTTVPVTLVSRSGSVSNWTATTDVYVTLHNNTTNDDYYFQTSPYNYDSDTDTFHLGDIPEGSYTVTFSYYNYTYWMDHFDWQVNDYTSYNNLMYSGNDYTVTTNATASAAIGEFYLMLYHI